MVRINLVNNFRYNSNYFPNFDSFYPKIFRVLYRLDKCFSGYFFIHRTLHPGKIYPVTK